MRCKKSVGMTQSSAAIRHTRSPTHTKTRQHTPTRAYTQIHTRTHAGTDTHTRVYFAACGFQVLLCILRTIGKLNRR